MSIADSEWEPVEHFILEFDVDKKIPFIDVYGNGAKSVEDNEIILTSKITLSDLELVRNGGMQMGFYTPDSIPIYKAKFTSNHNVDKVNVDELMNNFEMLQSNIEKYGKLIDEFFNRDVNIIQRKDYIKWCMKVSEFFRLYSNYIGIISKDKKNIVDVINNDVISKSLKYK